MKYLNVLCCITIVSLAGCAVVTEPLMPTPLIYQVQDSGPLDAVPPSERWNIRQVYYATTRQRDDSFQRVNYNNKPDNKVNVGMTMVGFGGSDLSWADLIEASKKYPRDEAVPLSLAGIFEVGSYSYDNNGDQTAYSGAGGWLISNINKNLAASKVKEIMIYVHGAKVNFYNGNVFAAQLDHFMGRDLVSVAFSWPTRQNILAYSFGDDLNRSYNSAPALVSLLKQLAEKTDAKKIHILTWSAGGRLVSSALDQMRNQYPEMNSQQLHEKYRLGTVYFAAADVPVGEFVQRLPAMDDMASRIVVTASSDDGALKSSEIFIRGGDRIGLLNPTLNEAEIDIVRNAKHLEYIDVSYGADSRGFDIVGHRYWFDHPWASTDVLLSIRSDLDPEKRGLAPTEYKKLWAMPEDYPERIKQIAQQRQ